MKYNNLTKYKLNCRIINFLFDIVILSSSLFSDCCPILISSNTRETNELYFIQDDLVNGRRYYVNSDGRYAYWFDGDESEPDWIRGYVSTLKAEKYTSGHLASYKDTVFPTATVFKVLFFNV